MIRRNRKKKTLNSSLMPVPLAAAFLALTGVALAYVALICRCETVGRSIKGLESEQALLKQQLSNEEAKWAEMKSVPNLERAMARHGLNMLPPRPGQTVQLRGRFYEGWVAAAPRSAGYLGMAKASAYE